MMAVNTSDIREHMKVVGSDGRHVGTVDRIEGDRIKLTKSDPAAQGKHQYIDLSQIDCVKDGEVCLAQSADEAKSRFN
jgi:hypothetical protein